MVLLHKKLLTICCTYQNIPFEGTSHHITPFHQTGDIKPVSRRSSPQRLLGDVEQVCLFQLILRNPGIYLHELQHRLQEAYGVRVHVSTICRTLKSMGCTRQVIRHVALQQSEAMLNLWLRFRYMTRQCLFGLTKVAVTVETASENTAIASVASVLWTTESWYEVLDTPLYL